MSRGINKFSTTKQLKTLLFKKGKFRSSDMEEGSLEEKGVHTPQLPPY
jgi:hypothetical protein